jgi:hypothetical protein
MEDFKQRVKIWFSWHPFKVDVPATLYKIENGYVFCGKYHKTIEECSEDFLKRAKEYFND